MIDKEDFIAIINEEINKLRVVYPQWPFFSPQLIFFDELFDIPEFAKKYENGHTCMLKLDECLELSDTNCTRIDFEHRSFSSIMIIHDFYLRKSLRNKKLGRAMLKSLESIAQRLYCNGKIYAKDVTNPGFWEHMGYRPLDNLHGGIWALGDERKKQLLNENN